MLNVKGHVALVTGSTAGLGKEIAMVLGRAGAKVAMNYANNTVRGEQAFGEFQKAGCRGVLVRADVSDEGQVNQMVRAIEDQLGPVDILVINATPPQVQKPIEEYDWEFYQLMVDFFIKSPFLLTRAVLPGMKAAKWGRIINIGSEVFERGDSQYSAYVAAKGGQLGWTRSMANELAPWNITVNLIAPGWILMDRHKNIPQELKDDYLESVPLGRWGRPEDIAAMALYFASEEASFITGQNICVNGGLTFP
jgi:3-oxoacyl-[acyl-carrier protein] reductase